MEIWYSAFLLSIKVLSGACFTRPIKSALPSFWSRSPMEKKISRRSQEVILVFMTPGKTINKAVVVVVGCEATHTTMVVCFFPWSLVTYSSDSILFRICRRVHFLRVSWTINEDIMDSWRLNPSFFYGSTKWSFEHTPLFFIPFKGRRLA